MTEDTVLLTDVFWEMLVEAGVVPRELNHITTFMIIGYPGYPLKIAMEKSLYEVETEEFVRFLDEYELVKKKEEVHRKKYINKLEE
jgi:hypothetical protein